MLSRRSLKAIPKGAYLLAWMPPFPPILCRFGSFDRRTITFDVGAKQVLMDRRAVMRLDVYPPGMEPAGLAKTLEDTPEFELRKSYEGSEREIRESRKAVGFGGSNGA